MLYNIDVSSLNLTQQRPAPRSFRPGPGLPNTLASVLSRVWDCAVSQPQGNALSIYMVDARYSLRLDAMRRLSNVALIQMLRLLCLPKGIVAGPVSRMPNASRFLTKRLAFG